MAVKILEKEKIKDKKDVERITREIKILKKVRHPNVIQLYEVSKRYSTIYPVLCVLILMLHIFYSHFNIMVNFYSW